MLPTLAEANEWMGRGCTPEDLGALAVMVAKRYPDMTPDEFARAVGSGLERVRWTGKLTGMAIAEFIRRYHKREAQMQLRREYRCEGWEDL